MISKEVSLKISLLSLVAAVLVVCIHMPSTSMHGLTQLLESYIGTHLAAAAVPFFFVVSGFLLGRHTEEPGWYRAALRKRIKTLLIPYLIWCVILGVAQNANSLLANIIHHQPLMRYIDLGPIYIFGLNPNVNPPQPLWYLRALILYVIVSPTLVWIARRRSFFALGVLGLFALGCWQGQLVARFPGELFVFTLAPLNILCFLLGIFFGRNVQLVETTANWQGCMIMAVALMLTLFNAICGHVPLELGSELSCLLRQVAISLTILGAWQICPAIELPTILRAQSFPIYLLHGVFMVAILAMKNVVPAFVESVAGYGFAVVFLVGCSIATSHWLRRWLPRFSKVIFGGR